MMRRYTTLLVLLCAAICMKAAGGLTLSDLTNSCEWEKRTQIPPRYDEVSVEELISRIMKL